jgi:hypothetical protein
MMINAMRNNNVATPEHNPAINAQFFSRNM